MAESAHFRELSLPKARVLDSPRHLFSVRVTRWIFTLSLLLLVGVAAGQFSRSDCPEMARCPEHFISGNPTGRVMWEGKIQYAEFFHELGNGRRHTWWVRCDGDGSELVP